jgi:hypothetical protein
MEKRDREKIAYTKSEEASGYAGIIGRKSLFGPLLTSKYSGGPWHIFCMFYYKVRVSLFLMMSDIQV